MFTRGSFVGQYIACSEIDVEVSDKYNIIISGSVPYMMGNHFIRISVLAVWYIDSTN